MPKNTSYVTKTHFDETLQRLSERFFSTFALHTDLEAVIHRLDRLEAKFDAGFANLDTYLKRTESWHDEQVILRASHQRL